MKKLKSLFYKLAPWAATVFGGPAAGYVVGQITKTLNLPDDASEKDIEVALGKASPDIQAKIKQIDANYKLEMKKAGIRLEEISSRDRDSARNREINVGSLMPRILSFLIIGGFVYMSYLALTGRVPADNMYAGIIIGAIITKGEAVVSYYFGSSQGSSDKNKIIEGLKQ